MHLTLCPCWSFLGFGLTLASEQLIVQVCRFLAFGSTSSIYGSLLGRLPMQSGSWWLERWKSSGPLLSGSCPGVWTTRWHWTLHWILSLGLEWPSVSLWCSLCRIVLWVLRPNPRDLNLEKVRGIVDKGHQFSLLSHRQSLVQDFIQNVVEYRFRYNVTLKLIMPSESCRINWSVVIAAPGIWLFLSYFWSRMNKLKCLSLFALI